MPRRSPEPFLPSQESRAAMDRISGLPDELLCNILSFLPTNFAFTTTLLSKRWTPLFYSLPVLRFDDNKFKDFQTYDRFYSFLNNLMIHPLSINQAHPLKTFRFKQCYQHMARSRNTTLCWEVWSQAVFPHLEAHHFHLQNTNYSQTFDVKHWKWYFGR